MKVLNKTSISHTIKIIDAQGKPDTIHLNPGRPVMLPKGAAIDSTMIAEYKKILRTDPPLELPAASE